MSNSIIEGTLGSAIADDGTFTVNYPSGKDEGHFSMGVGHSITIQGHPRYEFPGGVFLTFGASNITVKNKSGVAWAADARYKLQLEELGERQYRAGGNAFDRNSAAILPVTHASLVPNVWKGEVVYVSLGAPDALDVDGVCAAQAVAGAGNLTIAGALASGGVATLDVPRGLEIDSSNAGDTTQTITITGTDVYGKTIVEAISANGTTAVAGKKAFKTVTQVTASAAFAGNVTCGTTDLLGLPIYIPSVDCVLLELEDKVTATAGTFVAGVQTEGGSTATTGDVRGTYDANSVLDGALTLHLVLAVPDPTYLGMAQFAG